MRARTTWPAHPHGHARPGPAAPAVNEPASRTSPWRLTSRAPPTIRANAPRPPSLDKIHTPDERDARCDNVMLSPTPQRAATDAPHCQAANVSTASPPRGKGANPSFVTAAATRSRSRPPQPKARLPRLGRASADPTSQGLASAGLHGRGRGEVSISRPARSRRKTCGSSRAGRGAKRAGRGAATWRARPRQPNPSAPPRSAASRRARARTRR